MNKVAFLTTGVEYEIPLDMELLDVVCVKSNGQLFYVNDILGTNFVLYYSAL